MSLGLVKFFNDQLMQLNYIGTEELTRLVMFA